MCIIITGTLWEHSGKSFLIETLKEYTSEETLCLMSYSKDN